jgi:hypothetical protein
MVKFEFLQSSQFPSAGDFLTFKYQVYDEIGTRGNATAGTME